LKLIGVDWDRRVIQESSNQNLILINDNYKNLSKIVRRVRDDTFYAALTKPDEWFKPLFRCGRFEPRARQNRL